MARTRELQQMRSDIRIAADIVNKTARHPDSELTRFINESIQELRELVSSNGHSYYLQAETGIIFTGAKHIELPLDHIRVYGIDIDIDGESVALLDFQLLERNNYGGSYASQNTSGRPQFFRLVGVSPDGVPNVALLMPVSDGQYDYRIWYLPVWADLVNDTGTFDGVAGWEDWVKWDGCIKVAVRDKNAELFTMASQERAKREAEIITTAPKRSRVGPVRRIDTRSMRREAGIRYRRWNQ